MIYIYKAAAFEFSFFLEFLFLLTAFFMNDLITLTQTENESWKASVGEGTSDEIVKEQATNYAALKELITAMKTVLDSRNDIPGGWVGGRPNDR